jgi:hypothetical protein
VPPAAVLPPAAEIPPAPVSAPVPVEEPPEQPAAIADRKTNRASRPVGACVAIEPSDLVGEVRCSTTIRLAKGRGMAWRRSDAAPHGKKHSTTKVGYQ